jgi:hypothetical protein
MRIVETPDAIYLDTRGAACFRLKKRTSSSPSSSHPSGIFDPNGGKTRVSSPRRS